MARFDFNGCWFAYCGLKVIGLWLLEDVIRSEATAQEEQEFGKPGELHRLVCNYRSETCDDASVRTSFIWSEERGGFLISPAGLITLKQLVKQEQPPEIVLEALDAASAASVQEEVTREEAQDFYRGKLKQVTEELETCRKDRKDLQQRLFDLEVEFEEESGKLKIELAETKAELAQAQQEYCENFKMPISVFPISFGKFVNPCVNEENEQKKQELVHTFVASLAKYAAQQMFPDKR